MQWMTESAATNGSGAPSARTSSSRASVVTAIAATVLAISYALVNFIGVGDSEPSQKQRDRAELACTMDPSVSGGIYSDEFRNCVESRLR